jgi:cysteine desulfurase
MTPIFPTDGTIYLDHAATTSLDPEVLAAMLPYFSRRYGNPSSIYQLGQEARAALDDARGHVARVLGCRASEIVFTSGATESDNLALRGVAWARRLANSTGAWPHIVTTAIEHHAVLHTARALERQGFAVSVVPPDKEGIVQPEAVAAALRPETCVVSVMYANNEIGSIQPIRRITDLAHDRGIHVHTDAVQAAGLLPLDVDALGVDLLSLSAHKFYGPKGVGLLYIRVGTAIAFQQEGGSQEGGRRGGTENVPGIVGLGRALARSEANRDAYTRHCTELRDRLWRGISSALPDTVRNGPSDPALRLANNLNVSLPDVEGEMLLLSLDMRGVAASAGSACTTGNTEPSHVLRAIGLPEPLCRSALRFTVGWQNSAEQIDTAAAMLVEAVTRARVLQGALLA